MDGTVAFDTLLIEHPDFNASDAEAEIRRLFLRQKAIDDLLSGKADPEFVLDMLAEQGIDPSQYVEGVEENLLWVVSRNG